MKRLSSLFMIVVLVFVMFVCVGCSSPSANSEKVTLDEFNQIENGMTYDEVKEIIGSEGTVLSEVGEKDTDLYTVIYKWDGSGSTGANANFTFQGGKLQTKAQAGLK